MTCNVRLLVCALIVVTLPVHVGAQSPPQQPPGVPTQPEAPDPTNVTEPPAFPGADLMNDRQPFAAAVAGNKRSGQYVEGEKLSIQFKCERDAYLYLLYHQADGTTRLLFPNAAEPRNRIRAKQTVTVPPAKGKFRFRVRPPFGTEYVQVLAATAKLPILDAILQREDQPNIDAKTLTALKQQLQTNPNLWAEHRQPIKTFARQRPPTNRESARVGLFIGVGREQSQPDKGDPEMANSARKMLQAMTTRGQIDPQRSKLLVDQQATYTDWKKAIAIWLPSVSQPGDEVFIYIAAHAAYFENPLSSERDRRDEGFAPYDIDRGTRDMSEAERTRRWTNSFVLDDTLARWLQELHGRRIVLIVDACFAGGLTDGKSVHKVPLSKLRLNFFDDDARSVKDISQLETTILTSCSADEQALFEGTPDKTMWFTYFLLQSIENAKGPLTIKTAQQQTRKAMEQIVRKLGAETVQQPTLTENSLLPPLLVP